MTEPETPPPPARKPPRPVGKIALAVAAGVVVTAGAGLYLARLALARDVLTGWLEDRGVDADLSFDTFGFGGLSGSMKVGPANRPVLSVDRVEVSYGWGGFWSGDPFGLQVRSVHLVRPILHGTWTDKGLTLGPLDKIIEEFRKRPPRPDEKQPDILIDKGLMVLASPYGALEVRADAELREGRLIDLDASSSATRLVVGESAFALGPGGLTVRTKGDRVESLFQVYVAEARTEAGFAKAMNVRLGVQAPYPDLTARRADGPVAIRLVLEGDELAGEAGSLGQARVEARFDGRLAGRLEDLALTGSGQVEAAAGSGTMAETAARDLRVTFDAPEFAWNRRGGDRIGGRYEGAFKAAELTTADLRLRSPQVDWRASGDLGRGGAKVQLTGAAVARGGWSGLGPITKEDEAETAALKRALGDFDLAAPNFAVELDGEKLTVNLPAPLTVRTRSGGVATVMAVGAQPVYSAGGGRLLATSQGGGLPDVRLAVDDFTTVGGGLSARTRLAAKGSLGPAREATLETSGLVRVADGGFRYSARDCAAFSAARLEFGENDVDAVAGQLCPNGQPLLASEGGALRVRGDLRSAKATAPFLEMRAEDAAASLDLRLRDGGVHGQARVIQAKVDDTAEARRFYPLVVSGPVLLNGDKVRGELAAADRAGHRLAGGTLTHDLATGHGGLIFDTGELVFADGGLQPAEISPLAAPVASPAAGRSQFVGGIAWTPQGLSSQGRLKVTELDFTSPMGPVQGLAGEVVFDSLVPPKAAPGQTLRARRISILGEVTNAVATFGFDEAALHLEGVTAEVGGGEVAVEKLDIPFDPKASWSGAVNLSAVQVEDLVKASPFGDKVALNAKLSGRLPFTMTPEGVRIAGGELHAVEPGALSIQREALTGMQAQTEVGAAAPGVPTAKPAAPSENLVADFAYQALEHLAFDDLSAKVDSKPEGRLGVFFRIKGEFKPPQRQELRLGYLEVLRGTYMDKTLPLPSNTKVDLSLDTSVNLDQLLADYAEYQRLRGSGPVQP